MKILIAHNYKPEIYMYSIESIPFLKDDCEVITTTCPIETIKYMTQGDVDLLLISQVFKPITGDEVITRLQEPFTSTSRRTVIKSRKVSVS